MAATVSNRATAVLGPIKLEVLHLTGASDGDTVESRLQNPKFATGVVNTDGTAQTVALNAAISSRTITINQDALSSAEVVVFVFGF